MKHYTYAHILPDGRYFYIGKGTKRRAYKKDTRKAHWHAVADGVDYTVQILAHWATEAEAYEHEKFLIACFRDMGHPLVNKTPGGNPSEEAKARWQDPKYRAAITASASTPEAKARSSAALKAMWQNPETRASITAKPIAAASTPEAKARSSAAGKASAEARKRNAIAKAEAHKV